MAASQFSALFDSNTIYGFHLSDLFLALAERGLYRPRWSEPILEEILRNLVADGFDQTKIERRLTAMNAAFTDALVSNFEHLVPEMTNHRKDQHVLAAALHARACVLVTINLKDFPSRSTARYELEVVHPDSFLLDQLDLFPEQTLTALNQLIADYRKPLLTLDKYLDRLQRDVPDFAAAIRTLRLR